MDRLTRHDAIMAILGVPETHLSTVYKAGIIELLFDSTPYYIYNNDIKRPCDADVIYTSKEYKDTDNPAMYERPRDSYISNSSSSG